MVATPVLSVIVVTGFLRKLSSHVLQALLRQNIIDRMEILVVDCVSADTPPFPGSDHECVRLINMPADTNFEVAMVVGIRAARAPVVALLEEHCIVLPGWAEALVEAHKEPWGAVCGEVINGNPELGTSNAEFMTARNIRWQSPAEKGEVFMIDGHNSSYKRDILLGYGDQLEMMLRAEAVLLLKMREDGHKLLLEPAAKFIHVNEASLRSASSSLYYWHRIFGHTRAVIFHWSISQRLMRLLILPLLPWWHSAKTLLYILKKRRDQLSRFMINAPMILWLYYCESMGQAMGLLFGEGQAPRLFSERERDTERIPKTKLIQF